MVILGHRVDGGPAGGGRVVHSGTEVEDRDVGAEEGLGLLAGEAPAVRGGCGGHRGCRGYRGDGWLSGMLCPFNGFGDRSSHLNPLAELVVVAGLDDRTGVTVDDGADTAEVVAEVDERPVGDRAGGGGLTYYPAGGGHVAVKGYSRRARLTCGLGVYQGTSVLVAVAAAVQRTQFRAVCKIFIFSQRRPAG